jgi:hypothetical protein
MRRALTPIALLWLTACAASPDGGAQDASVQPRDAGARVDEGFTIETGDAEARGGAGGGGGQSAGGTSGTGGATDALVGPVDAAVPPPDAPPSGPPVAACANGQDDDADGLFDADDPDCSSDLDPTEAGDNAPTQCSDGLDQDANGLVDFPGDPGCAAAGDDDESSMGAAPCGDGEDNDDDGRVDRDDPGCSGVGDRSETDPAVPGACANGRDDDADGLVDFPEDTGCDGPGDPGEGGACGPDVEVVNLNAWLSTHELYQGQTSLEGGKTAGTCGGAAGGEVVFAWDVTVPTDRVTFTTLHPETTGPVVMYVRPTCGANTELACNRGSEATPGSRITLEAPAMGRYFIFVDSGSRDAGSAFALSVETVATPQCHNLIDDDADARIDAADPGCVAGDDVDEADPAEPAVCSNGVDDDGDGRTDYGSDADCAFAGGDREVPLCPDGVPTIPVEQAGGTFDLPAPLPGAGSAAGSCEPVGGTEVVLVLNLESPSEVTVDVQEGGASVAAGLHVRRTCTDTMSEVACRSSANRGPLRIEELPRGQSFVFVELGFVAPPVARQVVVTVTSTITECNDALDNDVDGRIDLDDTGCERGRDETEGNPADVPQCANGVDDDADGLADYPNDPHCLAAGDPEEMQTCLVGVFGGVCVNWLSPACIGGSATAICAEENRGRVITYQEFQAVARGGWMRPDDGYHTVTVDQYPDCGGGIGNTGIPGWGEFNLFNCGDDQNYCNRAVMCVR